MGNSKSSQKDFNATQWTKLYSAGNSDVLVSKQNPNFKIMEHTFKAATQPEFKKAEKLYNLRKDSKNIVATKYQDYTSENCCASLYTGNVYTEWIPITLNNVAYVPFPDVLHLYKQSLDGTDTLSSAKGLFAINEEMIGINAEDVVKVYHSPDFAQVQPAIRVKEEEDMVRSIVDSIEKNTDMNTMPRENPSFRDFLYRSYPDANLDQAKLALNDYASRYNQGRIPQYLQCVRAVGGAEKIRDTWLSQKGQEQSMNHPHQQSFESSRPQKLQSVPPPMHIQTSQAHLPSQNSIALQESVRPLPLPTNRTFSNQQQGNFVRNPSQAQAVQLTEQPRFQSPQMRQAPLQVTSQVRQAPIQVRQEARVDEQQPRISNAKMINPEHQIQVPQAQPIRQVQSAQQEHKQQIRQVQPVQQQVRQVQPVQQRQEIRQEIRHVQPVQQQVRHIQQQVRHVQPVQQQVRHIQPIKQEVRHVQPIQQEVRQEVRQQVRQPQVRQVQTVQQEVRNVQPIRQEVRHVQPAQQFQEVRHAPQPLPQPQIQQIRAPMPIQQQRVQGPQQQIVQGSSGIQAPHRQPVPNMQPQNRPVDLRAPLNGPVQVNHQHINQQQVIHHNQQQQQVIQHSSQQVNRQVFQHSNQQVVQHSNQLQARHAQSFSPSAQRPQQYQGMGSPQQQQHMSPQQQNSSRPDSTRNGQTFPKPMPEQQPIIRQQPPTPIAEPMVKAQSPNFRLKSSNHNYQGQNESMSSIGLSNVPTPHNKDMSEKFFSEMREESINNTTRNFYNNLVGDSQIENSEHNVFNKYKATNEYGKKKYNDGATADDFLEQLKGLSGKKDQFAAGYTTDYKEQLGYTNSNAFSFANATAANGSANGSGSPHRESEVYDYKGYEEDNVDYAATSYKADKYESYQAENYQARSTESAGYTSNTYEEYTSSNANYQSGTGYVPTYEYNSSKEYREYNDGELEYGFKATEHADNESYEQTRENLVGQGSHRENLGQDRQNLGQDRQKLVSQDRQRKKLDEGLEMKYSLMGGKDQGEEYAVEWDPEILADLQKNVHN